MPSGKKDTKLRAPSYLDAIAKAEYDALVLVLEASGKLPSTDPKLIEVYAVNYALLMRATIDLQTQALTFVSENKRPFVNPLIAVVHNTSQKLRQVIGDFALSPVTAKLVEASLPISDPLIEFMTKKG